MTITFNDFKKNFAKENAKNIPTEVVDLPSGLGKATIRPMKVREQKDFLKALEKKDEFLINEAFDSILHNCVETINGEPFDKDKIVIQDRTYLLIKIRQISTGNEVKISHICPKSEKVYNDIQIDLNNLQVNKADPKEIFKEIYLLNDKVKIKLSPVTRKTEKDLEKYLKANNNSIVDRRYCGYASVINEVYYKNEETSSYEKVDISFNELVEFITNHFSNKDLELLNTYISGLDFGIKLKFHFKSDVYENENEEANLISFFIM
jgi:hypothetical protein